jgi:hypothetical protein
VLSFSPKSLPVFRLIRCSLAQAWHWTASYSVSGTSSRWQQVHLDTATIDIRRAKNGTPGIHGLQGDELRLLRALRREHPHADFVFLSERKAPLSVDGAQKLIERLGEAAKLPFPIHAHMPAACGWLRPGGSWSRYKDAAGFHGPSLDCEHRYLHRGR